MDTAKINTALLVIDVQEYFVNRYTKDIPQKIASFVRQNNFDSVFFFTFINSKDSIWYKQGWRRMMKKPEINIVPELTAFLNKENTLRKTAFSVFRIKGFNEMLKKRNIQKLYICGLDTHACVFVTTMEASERGYDVKVISDLCGASHGKKYHEFALDVLTKNLGNEVLINSKDIK